MKVAFIVDSFPSVSETFILRQVEAFLNAGHELLIFAGTASAVPCADPRLRPLVRLHHAKPENPLLRVLLALWRLPGFLFRAPKVFCRSLNVFRYRHEAWSLNYYFQANCFCEAGDADVIIAHFGPNGIVGARMKEMGALSGRLYCFFHAYDLTSYVARSGKAVYVNLFKTCEALFAISRRGERQLALLGCPSEKIKLCHMGLAPEEYFFREDRFNGHGTLRILSVARLVEKKGISFALEAVKLLIEAGIKVRYAVIGDGPLRRALEANAALLGIAAHVSFEGSLDNEAVKQAMAAADVLIQPSITASSSDEEGIPVVLMEALASGLPVVAADSGAVREIIIDGETGVLVLPKDAPGIKEGVMRLLRDPSSRQSMSRAGRKLVEGEFNIRILFNELESFLKESHVKG